MASTKIYNLHAGKLVYLEIVLFAMPPTMILGLKVHPVAAIVGFFAVSYGLYKIWQTEIGFKIWRVISTIAWAIIAFAIIHNFADKWWCTLGGIVAGFLAFRAHNVRKEIESNFEVVE